MKKSVVIVAIYVLIIGLTAQAAIVNVDFVRNEHPSYETGVGALTAETGPMFWNALVGNAEGAPVTISDIADSAGAATTVDIVYTKTNRDAWAADSVQCSTLAYGAGHDLMQAYLTTQGAVDYVTIQGLTAGNSYDLYLFGHGDNEAQNTQFTVDGVTKGSSIDVTGLEVLTLDAHYVVFSGVVADGTGAIEIAFENGPDNEWGSFNGMQIVGDVVPEPATLVLLGLGSLVSLKRRK